MEQGNPDENALRNEMKDKINSLQKRILVAAFIALVIVIIGLYAIILLKH